MWIGHIAYNLLQCENTHTTAVVSVEILRLTDTYATLTAGKLVQTILTPVARVTNT